MKKIPEGVEELLTVEEVGLLLQVRPSTVRRLVKRGQLPAPLRLNQRVMRWSKEEVRRFVDREAERSRQGRAEGKG
jgi:excisionase family DNA binding protein